MKELHMRNSIRELVCGSHGGGVKTVKNYTIFFTSTILSCRYTLKCCHSVIRGMSVNMEPAEVSQFQVFVI